MEKTKIMPFTGLPSHVTVFILVLFTHLAHRGLDITHEKMSGRKLLRTHRLLDISRD